MEDTLCIHPRFCGPDNAGNGGYTAGLAAAPLGPRASVTLRAPAPLDTPLTRHVTAGGVALRNGDTLIAEAVRAAPAIDLGEVPRVAPEGGPPVLGRDAHFFPRCFVCGPDRAAGDGLRIMPSASATRPGVVATRWIPDGESPGSPVPAEFVWAALDCPSGWSLFVDRATIEPVVLGRLTVHLVDAVAAGRPYTIVGWHRGQQGRKRFAGSAIVDGDRVVALAEALWIRVNAAAWVA